MNPYAKDRHCALRVIFRVMDLTAAADVHLSASSEAQLSQLGQLILDQTEMTAKLGTLEPDFFLLDGSFEFPPDDPRESHTGWWSESLSDAEGNIDESLTFSFSKQHDSFGLTFWFDDKSGQYASKFKLFAYQGETLLDEQTVENDSTYCRVDFPVEGYDRIVAQFLKTGEPQRRVRLASVLFGVIEEFTGHNTKDVKVLRELSPDSKALPTSEVSVTFDNLDQKYNMTNPEGIFRFLEQKQIVDVEMGIGDSREAIEYLPLGRYYFQEAVSRDNSLTAEITAQNAFMFLDKLKYTGTEGTIRFEDYVGAVLSGLQVYLNITMPAELADTEIRNTAKELNCRDALRLACEAVTAVCYIDTKNTLHFKRLEKGAAVDVLDDGNMSAWPEVTAGERYNVCKVFNTGEEPAAVYADIGRNETEQVLEIKNERVTQELAPALAKWKLEQTRDLKYTLQCRGNPLRDIGDTIEICDRFGTVQEAIIIRETINFSGGIKETVEAVGGRSGLTKYGRAKYGFSKYGLGGNRNA